MREAFSNWKPNTNSRNRLEIVNQILSDYEKMGYSLTLRQLYYQLVSRDLIPNSDKQYKQLGELVSKARLAGLIDWDCIEDRLRRPTANSHWESVKQIIATTEWNYYLDRWINQDHYIEVWCEKDAVSNIIQPVCKEYDVVFMANRGYSSQSAMYRASKRFLEAEREGKELHVIYLGDHDPSGIDMSRDIEARLNTFTVPIECERIALNMDQVRKYKMPENPAKLSDSRAKGYIRRFGHSSWELDAMQPKILERIVRDSILEYADMKEFSKIEDRQRKGRREIALVSDNWDKAVQHLKGVDE